MAYLLYTVEHANTLGHYAMLEEFVIRIRVNVRGIHYMNVGLLSFFLLLFVKKGPCPLTTQMIKPHHVLMPG